MSASATLPDDATLAAMPRDDKLLLLKRCNVAFKGSLLGWSATVDTSVIHGPTIDVVIDQAFAVLRTRPELWPPQQAEPAP